MTEVPFSPARDEESTGAPAVPPAVNMLNLGKDLPLPTRKILSRVMQE